MVRVFERRIKVTALTIVIAGTCLAIGIFIGYAINE